MLSGGKGDNEPSGKRRRSIFKPTGLLGPRRKIAEAPSTDQRVAETQEIAREIYEAARVARALHAKPETQTAIEMTPAEIDFEIGVLLKKAMRTADDEILLLTLMAAAAA